MKRVIFVGMHNKGNMLPLDSRTRSGKIIDKIIHELPKGDYKALKTNLCDTDYQPDDMETLEQANNWVSTYQPTPYDVVVLLGRWVHENFLSSFVSSDIIKLAHPASTVYSSQGTEKYIDRCVNVVSDALSLKTTPND